MNMNYYALILTTLAGLATIIGYFFIYVKNKKNNIISGALGFSAGIMLFISLIDLLPESYHYFHTKYIIKYSIILCIFFMILGSAISFSLNNIVKNNNSNLYRVGILSMITLILHNIPEGIITYLTSTIEIKTGIILALSIATHNIPEGICIAIPIYYSTKNKYKAFSMVLISALSEPIGALIAYLFFQNYLSNIVIAILLSLVSGIMMMISISEILKEGFNYSIKRTLKYLFIGIFIAFISHLLF